MEDEVGVEECFLEVEEFWGFGVDGLKKLTLTILIIYIRCNSEVVSLMILWVHEI